MIQQSSTGLRRITVVMPSASPTGGAEEAFLQLIRSDAAEQIEWQVIFLEPGPLVDAVTPHVSESTVVACGRTRELWKWWKAARSIARRARDFESELILGWMTKGQVYGGLAARLAKIPAVWFQMGLPESGLLDHASRRLPSAAVFTCSEFVAGEQRSKQSRSNVVAIPLGVDLTRFDLDRLPSPREARSQLGLPSDGPLIGIVGRLQRWKGMHVLIDAMPEVLSRFPDAHCVVVGGPYPAEPDYERELHELAVELEIDGRVTFAGAQKDVPVWMQAMDVFVHASNREPFGIVVVEALALGKPVIACAPGGPSEIIGDEAIGQLVPYEEPAALSDAICQELGRTDSAESNCRIAKRFSSESFASNVLKELEISIQKPSAESRQA